MDGSLTLLRRLLVVAWYISEWVGDGEGEPLATSPSYSTSQLMMQSTPPEATSGSSTSSGTKRRGLSLPAPPRSSGLWWHRFLGYELLYEVLEAWLVAVE